MKKVFGLIFGISLLILFTSCTAMLYRMAGVAPEGKRLKYIKTHPDRPSSVLQAIEEGSLCVGMNKDEVKLVRNAGMLEHIEYDFHVYGETRMDIWTYVLDKTGDIRFIIYFENGICTGWSKPGVHY